MAIFFGIHLNQFENINTGIEVKDHFPDVRKMVQIGSGAEKEVKLYTHYENMGYNSRLAEFKICD